jgi:hypothetical protein
MAGVDFTQRRDANAQRDLQELYAWIARFFASFLPLRALREKQIQLNTSVLIIKTSSPTEQ